MKKVLLIPTILILLAPVVTWAMYKPARVLAPNWVDSIICVDSTICIDDKSRYSEASKLYASALQFVDNTVGPFQKNPRVIFCTKKDCFQSFGFKRAASSTVSKFGIVVSPRGWRFHYLRHEMIHHRQAEELGALALLLYPQWFIEGMAYSLSEDPRQILSDSWQRYRTKFEAWYQNVSKDQFWADARKL
jgi:hypothetical protein